MTARLRRLIRTVALVCLLGLVSGVSIAFSVVILTDLPQVEALESYEPKGVTTLLDIHGDIVHEFYRERRISLPYERIPEPVRKAFLAAEDWRFYNHFGIDMRGLFRALVKNVLKQRYAEGASTITQQLAKVLFLSPEKTLQRKLKEALLAVQIERRYSKNEILALYLNQIYLGSGCYGIEAAARTYFGKTVADLNVPEIALLAGLPKAPSRFSPFLNPDRARKRRDVILRALYQRNLISKPEWDAGREADIPEKPSDDDRIQSYFAAYVLKQLGDELGEDQIYRGRLTVQTTLDARLQKTAEASVAKGIEAYAKRHHATLDEPEKLPQAGLLAVDVTNGEIRAMVGGRSFAESQFNRTVQALRQPGSAFKAIVVAAALERGYTQSSIVDDEPIVFDNPESGRWEPENYTKEYDGPIPLRRAMEQSKNVVAVRLLQAIGLPALRQMALRLGIQSEIAYNLSSALGSSSMTLADMTRAFGTFASGGIRHPLRAVRSVRTPAGVDLWPPPPPSQAVLDSRIAYIMTDLLSGVIRAGTGRFASDLPCAVAGKTGTTNDYVDSFFAGYSTDMVTVSWVGFDDNQSLGFGETGARAAGRMWKSFMEPVCQQSEASFTPPRGVMLVDVDHSSGQLPSRYCTDVIAEAFVEGTAPTEMCEEETIPRL